jgi:uncharacterized BrkB/YihY/UPF0761 family membrane protein
MRNAFVPTRISFSLLSFFSSFLLFYLFHRKRQKWHREIRGAAAAAAWQQRG